MIEPVLRLKWRGCVGLEPLQVETKSRMRHLGDVVILQQFEQTAGGIEQKYAYVDF